MDIATHPVIAQARDLADPRIGWVFRGFVGLGDQVYMRPFVLDAVSKGLRTYVCTPWPELYWNLPGKLRFLPEDQGFRTQRANLLLQDPRTWSAAPRKARVVTMDYSPNVLKPGSSIVGSFMGIWPTARFDFEIPIAPAWERAAEQVLQDLDLGGRELCLVYLPTVRHEWYVPARNPKPEYVNLLLDRHKDRFYYLAVGWIEPGQESLDGDFPLVDKLCIRGELHYTTIAALMKRAPAVISHSNFMVPLGTAVRANLFVIHGGFTKPGHTLDERMDLRTVRWVAPDPFCDCYNGTHNCNKDIPQDVLFGTFERFISEVVDRPPASYRHLDR